jgi:hypothetical protein
VRRFSAGLRTSLGVAAILAATWLAALELREPAAPAIETASTGFRVDVDRYVDLRHRLERTMSTPRVTADASEIEVRRQALRLAVQAARPAARQGEIFDGAAGVDFRRIIAADLRQRSVGYEAAITSDVALVSPHVNELYPPTLPLATFPPLLLAALPALPSDLEYRFMGSDLIIRDTKTNLIVDYLPGVVPPAGQELLR